jgi:ABC-2 type transport system ATP-binding protein
MISISHLSKHFRIAEPGRGIRGKLQQLMAPRHRTIRAVDDVSFEIARGEIVGYLGPNGAGKSTTIKLLTGVLTPTAGTLLVNGLVPHTQRTANAYNVGVVYGQRSQLWWDLPLVDSFEALAAMYRIPKPRYRATLEALVELLEMAPLLDQPVRKLSLGQRMRGDLAAALLHEPPILFLDEPTIGLDVVAKNRVLAFLAQLSAERQTTILFTSHNLSDVERLCPRILILDRGKVILDAAREAVVARFGEQRQLVVDFHEVAGELVLPVGEILRTEANRMWIAFRRDEISAFDLIGELGQVAQQQGYSVRDVSIVEPDIESIVGQIYEHGIAEPGRAKPGSTSSTGGEDGYGAGVAP